MSDALSAAEVDLLIWLGMAEFSQYGECHGAALDGLVRRGLARIHDGRDGQAGFIVQGDTLAYRAVSLTEAGHERRRKLATP